MQFFSEEDEARLFGELREVFSNPIIGDTISNSDIREIAHKPETRILILSRTLSPGQRAFQMATQLCFLEHGTLLADLTRKASFSSHETVSLARIGLANYFAGAVILPYGPFLQTAEALRYDIDLLGQKFGVGFETVCHRLSTLQRRGASGVPFFFIRVDRAGNISKRQSATDFHFSRIGGTCPLWQSTKPFPLPDGYAPNWRKCPMVELICG